MKRPIRFGIYTIPWVQSSFHKESVVTEIYRRVEQERRTACGLMFLLLRSPSVQGGEETCPGPARSSGRSWAGPPGLLSPQLGFFVVTLCC